MNADLPTVAEVVAKLTTKGSADQIAAFFKAQQVQGYASESKYCPVAQYITRETGESVSVGISHVLVLVLENYDFGRRGFRIDGDVKLDVNGPIAEFIWRFDGGRYPELACGMCTRPEQLTR